MSNIGVAMLFRIAFKVAFLIHYGTGVTGQVIVSAETLV